MKKVLRDKKDLYNIHGIRAAYIHVSDVCNFKCKICNLPIERKGGFVSLKDMKKNIRIAIKLNLKNLIFTGQEVILHPNFEEICRFAFEEAGANYITFNTNGLAFYNKKTIKLVKNLEKYTNKIYYAISCNFYDKKTFSAWSGHNENVFYDWVEGVENFLKLRNKLSVDIILKKDVNIFKILKFIENFSRPASQDIDIRILDLMPFGYTKGEVFKRLKYNLVERSENISKIKNYYSGLLSFESFPFCSFNQSDLKRNKYFMYNFYLLFDGQTPIQYDPNIYETSYNGKTENWLIDTRRLRQSYNNMFSYVEECSDCHYRGQCYGIEREYIKARGLKKISKEIKILKKKNWNLDSVNK